MKRLMLIKYNFQNEIRHEFYNVSVELKKKLSLNIPIKYIFPLAFIYQNTFIFLILLFLFSIKDTTIFNVVSVLIMLFNLFLPITLARTENNRLIYNPAYQTLQLGELGNKEVLRILLYSETVNFWIHNFMLEFITLFLFVVKFGINGLLLSLIWIFLISYMYQKSLLSNQSVNIKTKTAFRYLGGQVVNVMLTIIMFTILINPSHRIKFNNILNGSSIREYFKHYYQQIENNAITFFNDYTSLIYIGISILLYLLISYIFGDFILKKIYETKNILFYKISNFIFYRDIKMIDNIIHNFNIDKYFLALPTGSIFLLVVSILYINKQYPSEITLVSIDAMYWVVLYQTSNYIIRYLPILNISSELRNINLLYFSEKYSVNDLIKSKYRLLFQFTLPITVVNILVKLVILILNGMNFIGFILTIFLTIILTITSHIISLKWTLIGPKFNFDNIFMIRQERFDTQILQQFTIIPFRVITIFLGFAFFIVNFTQVQIPGGIYIIYNVLCLLICILFILLLYRRSNNEYYSKI